MSDKRTKTDRIGEKRMMHCGLEAEIVEYASKDNIDIRFSDGCVVKGKSYKNFRSGEIKHPAIAISSYKNTVQSQLQSQRIGEKKTLTCGVVLEIVNYISYRNITISVSKNGNIFTKKWNYRAFQHATGNGSHLCSICNTNNYTSQRAVKKKVNNNTCKKNNACKEYSDRREVYDHLGNRFASIRRLCLHYNIPVSRFKRRMERGWSLQKALCTPLKWDDGRGVKTTIFQHCGMSCKLVKYNNSRDVTVEFEDGNIVSGQRYQGFLRGQIQHPQLTTRKKSFFCGFSINYITTSGNQSFYNVKCAVCGEQSVMTPQQMIEHAKEHENE